MKLFWSCFSVAVLLSQVAHADVKPSRCLNVQNGTYRCNAVINGMVTDALIEISSGIEDQVNFLKVGFGQDAQKFACFKGKEEFEKCSMEERASSDEMSRKCAELGEYSLKYISSGEVRNSSMKVSKKIVALSLLNPQELVQKASTLEIKKIRGGGIQLNIDLQVGPNILSIGGSCALQAAPQPQ